MAPRTGSRTVPIADRIFVSATTNAERAYAEATKALTLEKARGAIELPNAPISALRRADDRITAYGNKSWLDLFNSRQLLHLGLLRKAITDLPEEVHRRASSITVIFRASGL
jgi:adenine-specific DNA methylase